MFLVRMPLYRNPRLLMGDIREAESIHMHINMTAKLARGQLEEPDIEKFGRAGGE
jgi:hypothetical protein